MMRFAGIGLILLTGVAPFALNRRALATSPATLTGVALTSAAKPLSDGKPRVIQIASGDVASLQAVVSNPANADTVVVLAPGEYAVTQPLVLQSGQFLQGPNEYRFKDGVPAARDAAGTVFADPAIEAVIDLGLLAAGPNGIVISRGGLVGLTVRNGPNVNALVQVAATAAASGDALIERCDLWGGQRAVRVQHANAAQQGLRAHVVISRSILRDGVGFFAFGYQFQVGGQAHGSSLSGLIEHSLVRGNHFGGFVAGLADQVAFEIESRNNRYEANGVGLALNPARDAVAALGGTHDGAVGNRLRFTTDQDTFAGNGTYSAPLIWPDIGAISAVAAYRTAPAPATGPHSNTVLWLDVRKPSFEGNVGADVLAYGAVALNGAGGQPASVPAGSNNTLYLSLDVKKDSGRLLYCDSVPADATGSNRVRIFRDADRAEAHCAPLQ